MIHFLPDPDQVQVAASPFHERVHGLSQALQVLTALGEDAPGAFRAVPELGSNISGMALDLSDRIASASAAGLEAIAALREIGLEANPAAAQYLADMIRDGLDRLGAVTSL
jgi:hypothetical protein